MPTSDHAPGEPCRDEHLLDLLRRSPRHAWHDLRHAVAWYDQLAAGEERAYEYRFAVTEPGRPLPMPYPTYHVVVERILELLEEVGAVQPILDWPTWYERHQPSLPEEVAAWPSHLLDRTRVLPGITGLWQVSGRSDTTFDDYARLDLYYVDNWSLRHDWRIVRKTIGAVLRGSGAS